MPFSRLIDQIGEQKFNQLTSKSVLILGLGGVGGHATEAIARSGFGTIILVDHDTVSKSNVNRQIIALQSTINERKVDLMEQRILDINPQCIVKKYPIFYNDETKQSIWNNDIDYVIDCIDTITFKIDAVKEAYKRHIPMISVMGTGNKYQPESLQIMPLSKTEYDPIARIMRQKLRDEVSLKQIAVIASKEQPMKRNVPYPTSNSYVPATAGILAASYIFRLAIGEITPF